MSDPVRYARQVLVAEIGLTGQARIEGATFSLAGSGLTHEIATTYAARAGAARIAPGAIDDQAMAPTFLLYPACRAVVAGSRAALLALRSALLSEQS